MSVEITRLNNGIHVITHHMPHLETAALGIWVKAGARDERAEENGVAHFLGHMAFKGTPRRSARAIAEICQLNGLGDGTVTPEALDALRQACIRAGNLEQLELEGVRSDRLPVLPGGIAIMRAALSELVIEGLPTNLARHQGILADPEFRHGPVYTNWLDAHERSSRPPR